MAHRSHAVRGPPRQSLGWAHVPAADHVIEILVVDDEAGFRRTLTAVVAAEADMVVVGEAADGGEAVVRAIDLLPHVVLLDVRMPGTGGIEAARAIKDWLPTTTVVMLTASDEEDDLYKALRAGASGYLLKENALVDVCVSVRAAACGQAVLSPSMAAKLYTEFAAPALAPTPRLSNRELQILQLLAEGLANRQIAEALTLSPHTVKRHVANILAKLHQRSRLEAVLFAQRRDLLD